MSDTERPTLDRLRVACSDWWLRYARRISVELAFGVPFVAVIWVFLALSGYFILWAGLIILALGVVQIAIRLRTPNMRQRTAKPLPSSIGVLETRALIAAAQKTLERYSAEELTLLTRLILDPSKYRRRVTEEFTLRRRMSTRQVTTDFRLPRPRGNQSSILVPLVVPPKGRLYERRETRDVDGRAIAALSQHESQEVTAALLLHAFTRTFGLSGAVTNWDPGLGFAFHELVRTTILLPGHALRPPKPRSKSIVQIKLQNSDLIRKHLASIDVLIGSSDPGSAVELRRLATIFTWRYLVLAEVSAASSLTLTTCYEVPTREQFIPSPDTSALPFTRAMQELFHIPSGYVRLPLSYARMAQSFHLYVKVPEGSYLGPSTVAGRDSDNVLHVGQDPESARTVPYLRRVVHSGSGAHLYGRGLALIERSDFHFRVYERPWGTELVGAISAMVVLVQVVMQRAVSASQSVATDTATVALTVPLVLVAIALLFPPLSERSLALSTAGVLEMLIAAVLAVVLSVMFQLGNASRPDGKPHLEWLWNISTALILVLTLVAIIVFIIRGIRFSFRGRKAPL